MAMSGLIHKLILISIGTFVKGEDSDVNCNHGYVVSPSHPSGTLRSYNYPFHYRRNVHCTYVIYVNNTQTDDVTDNVCFLFRRFDTRISDYLAFHNGSAVHKYHGTGELLESANSHLTTVWNDQFCWPATGGHLEVTFLPYSYTSESHRGYYATFWLQQHNPAESLGGLLPNTTAPCLPGEWTCFNRGCIQKAEVCDEVNSCGDWSDEMYSHAGCMTGPGGPSLHSCDFTDGHTCGLQGLAKTAWVTQSSNSDPERGPKADHTGGGSKFVRTNFSRASNTDHLGLTCTEVTLAANTSYCLSFWYHVAGPRVGRLRVYYLPAGIGRPLWSRTANYSQRWLHGQVYISEGVTGNGSGQIYFGGERSYDYNTSLSLDDISLTISNSAEECNTDDISCTFEFDWCGWRHDDRFVRVRGNQDVNGNGGPEGNPSALGVYQYYVTVRLDPSSDVAWLQSPLYGSHGDRGTYRACVQLWIYEAAGLVYTISTVGYDGSQKVHNAYSNVITYGNVMLRPQGQWREHLYDVSHEVPFTVLIGVHSLYTDQTFGVDDIAIIEGSCQLVELQSCAPEEFRCHNGMCVDLSRACDGVEDCWDGSDEEPPACCYKNGCEAGEFCCRGNQKCIFDGYICDGENDCGDWSDEDVCSATCPSGWFHCVDKSRCIKPLYKCDGTADCDDGSDEDEGCLLLPPGAITGICVVAGAIAIMILVRVFLCSKSRRPKWCPRWPCCRGADDAPEGGDEEVAPEPVLYQQPPDYAECVNNPVYRRNLSTDSSKSGSTDVLPEVHRPPSYDRIEKGEFETTIITEKEATRKLRQLIMSKSREDLDSTLDDSRVAATSGVPAQSEYETVVEVNHRPTGPRGTVNRGYRGSADDLSSSDDASMVSRPAVRILRAHQGKPVSRVGSNASARSLPRYSDLPHPPAYDNLSFCDDDGDYATIPEDGWAPAHLDTISESRGRRDVPVASNSTDENLYQNNLTHNRSVESPKHHSVYRAESDRLTGRVQQRSIDQPNPRDMSREGNQQESTSQQRPRSVDQTNPRHQRVRQNQYTKSRSKSTTHINHMGQTGADLAPSARSKSYTNVNRAGEQSRTAERRPSIPDGAQHSLPRPAQTGPKLQASRDLARSMPNLYHVEQRQDRREDRLEQTPQLDQNQRPELELNQRPELELHPRSLSTQRSYSQSHHNLHASSRPSPREAGTLRKAKSQMTIAGCAESFV